MNILHFASDGVQWWLGGGSGGVKEVVIKVVVRRLWVLEVSGSSGTCEGLVEVVARWKRWL